MIFIVDRSNPISLTWKGKHTTGYLNESQISIWFNPRSCFVIDIDKTNNLDPYYGYNVIKNIRKQHSEVKYNFTEVNIPEYYNYRFCLQVNSIKEAIATFKLNTFDFDDLLDYIETKYVVNTESISILFDSDTKCVIVSDDIYLILCKEGKIIDELNKVKEYADKNIFYWNNGCR